jgi:hypothetical protein
MRAASPFAIRRRRAILDLPAEDRNPVEAIRCADPSHAMSKFAQLSVAARFEGTAQFFQLPAAVLDEPRDQLLEMPAEDDRVGLVSRHEGVRCTAAL